MSTGDHKAMTDQERVELSLSLMPATRDDLAKLLSLPKHHTGVLLRKMERERVVRRNADGTYDLLPSVGAVGEDVA
ncbi:hypothetical protein [Marinobacter sp. MDS2]|uniref:hypothetical protein n=1 Tax=Marinobacter sp. MDS2 TaxID=3065961 RepID=UPI00273ABBD4|nr:hypothetical protein [Marinobacter sp. MDS2]MDP4546511.1 hypothetical protein [Marinobacter sp. MDS2]